VESEEHVNGLLVNHSGSLIRSHLDGIDSWRGGGVVTRGVFGAVSAIGRELIQKN
jgi:hypothetical protein